MAQRAFRTSESLREEQITRRMVANFLGSRGFDVTGDHRVRNGQTIEARVRDGDPLVMRVKLCWRRGSVGRDGERHSAYSAAQLMARVEGDDWLGSISRKMEQERSRGSTHLLLVQRDGQVITTAALIPILSVVDIWILQRDLSDEAIKTGKLGRRKKNHAMNGRSPTLWLEDQRGGETVAAALWDYPSVVNIGNLAETAFIPEEVESATDYQEGATKQVFVNAYERDTRARRVCIEHYGPTCIVCGFNFEATYGSSVRGHIHVHHLRPLSTIGRTYVVNPIADLRPVCPNCHAVIHFGGSCRTIEEAQEMLGRVTSN
jgi:5-methylcytosine-specific restriction protein A